MVSPAVVLLAWAVLSVVSAVLGIALDPPSISNFTTWVWLLQMIFFTLYALMSFGKWSKDSNILLNAFFLPVVFACEWTTAIAVIYMMVVKAELFEANKERYGMVVSWIGNIVVHYLTMVVLIYYMHLARTKYDISSYIKNHPSKFDYVHVIGFATFILLFSYIVLFHPNQHYGIPSATDFEVAVSILLAGGVGVATFLAWTQAFEW